MNSRAKGCRGELEVRDLLRKYGFTAERGQQRAGGADSQDVKHDMEGWHLEVKFVEAFSLWNAMDQAERDSEGLALPVVFHRKKRRPWVAILDAETFLQLVRKGVIDGNQSGA
jgi:hypothetical protein